MDGHSFARSTKPRVLPRRPPPGARVRACERASTLLVVPIHPGSTSRRRTDERLAKDNECLHHFVIFGERHLRFVPKEFMAHYHGERFHQGLGGQLIEHSDDENRTSGKVVCRSRLGGILNFYHREAA